MGNLDDDREAKVFKRKSARSSISDALRFVTRTRSRSISQLDTKALNNSCCGKDSTLPSPRQVNPDELPALVAGISSLPLSSSARGSPRASSLGTEVAGFRYPSEKAARPSQFSRVPSGKAPAGVRFNTSDLVVGTESPGPDAVLPAEYMQSQLGDTIGPGSRQTASSDTTSGEDSTHPQQSSRQDEEAAPSQRTSAISHQQRQTSKRLSEPTSPPTARRSSAIRLPSLNRGSISPTTSGAVSSPEGESWQQRPGTAARPARAAEMQEQVSSSTKADILDVSAGSVMGPHATMARQMHTTQTRWQQQLTTPPEEWTSLQVCSQPLRPVLHRRGIQRPNQRIPFVFTHSLAELRTDIYVYCSIHEHVQKYI